MNARATVADFEREARTPILNNLIAIQKVLEEEGEIEFIPKNGGGEGVRFRSSIRSSNRLLPSS
ncbi:MAG: XRE family transcriptional regulator [Cyanobacteria bacterium J06635_10]